MKTKVKFSICPQYHLLSAVCPIAVILHFGVRAAFAQTGVYLYSGSIRTITLNPGTYTMTAYGAQGGKGAYGAVGGLGAEMSAKFSFSGLTTLTLLVGGGGVNGRVCGGGGGGGSFVVKDSTPLLIAGGGGGAYSAGALGDVYGDPGNIGSAGSKGRNGNSAGLGGSDGSGGSGANASGWGAGASGGGGGYSGSGGSGFGGIYCGAGGKSFLAGGAGGAAGNPYGETDGNGGFGGGGGGGLSYGGGGGGGYSGGGGSIFGGGGGGSFIDSSATMVLATLSGIASPDGSPNGGIIIVAVPEPMVTCPMPLTLECTNGSAVGTVQVSVVDTNGLPLEVIWTVDGIAYQTNDIPSGGSITASNVTFTANFGAGEHTVVISASNGQTTPASCSTTVTVGDTLPPTVLQISVTPSSLWPPNHRMVPVSVIVKASDNCDPSPVTHITHVTSNEPQNPFAPDWEVTGPLTVNLRAERLGSKSGRIYTVVVECEDASGNVSKVSVDVAVPSRSKMTPNPARGRVKTPRAF